VRYATDPAARERKRARNAARSLTVEGRWKRYDENQRRTRRLLKQRIAEHDARVLHPEEMMFGEKIEL
jgi:hypothetical protein